MKNAFAAVACVLLAWTASPAVWAHPIPDDITIDPDSLSGGLESLTCLALNDYWEARGESLEGRVAVARVVLNRVADARYPETVCAVIHQHLVPEQPRACQFSWTCDGRADTPVNDTAWRRSVLLAVAMLQEESALDDPTGGALWYHAASVRPAWIAQLVEATVIGSHTFYRDPPVPPLPLPRPDVTPDIPPDITVAEIADSAPLEAFGGPTDGILIRASFTEQVATAH